MDKVPPWRRNTSNNNIQNNLEKILDPESAPPLTWNLTLFDITEKMIVNPEKERIPHNITQHCQYKIYLTNICDINGDYYVGIDDIVLTASSFGWTPTYDP